MATFHHHRRSGDDDPAFNFVTNGELDKKLDEKPGRWEVRFLIVVAVIIAPSIPSAADVAQAAVSLVK